MTDDLKVEYFLLRIREKLNNDKIKLWLPPYLRNEKSEKEEIDYHALEGLADKFSVDLEIDKNICVTALRELQKHALDKLHEKEVYNETGVAVIKVKLSGLKATNSSSYNNNNSSSVNRILSIRINLSSFTSALCNAISDEIDIPPQGIKLISRGKVLSNAKSLESQGIKHGVQIMAVILSSSSSDLREYEKHVEILERMKGDVKLLADSVGPDEDTYLQVADQSGKTLYLPVEEKKALVTAMALHEKGRAALKKEEYALALVFLLEADKEFSNCNSQLLNSVDNYALLNLDIAWCYLCLRNVTQLPDAEHRLKVCESKFKYSYGPNLERLVALKGSSGNEAALLMRLHLLQGIVLFHQNKRDEARKILKEAQGELSMLKVDDNSLCSLIEFGLTPAEARIALRATKGCVNSAIDYIHRKRLEKEEILKREIEAKEKRKLGLCKDNKQYVEPNLVAELESKGYTRTVAVEALRHANNEINGAVSVIHEQPELLTTSLPADIDQEQLMELIGQIAAMGYDPLMAKQALRNHNGDLRKAVEELMINDGIIPIRENESSSSSSSNGSEMPSSSTSHRNGNGAVANLSGKRKKREKEAFDRFSEGLNTDVDDHLDITLEQEEQFLSQYLSLLL